MEKLIQFFNDHAGYARMKDLKKAGIHTRIIARALEQGIIEKIKPGLYKLSDFPWDEHTGFVDVYMANSSAVICLLSALEYYDLTTFVPAEIQVAVPHNSAYFHLDYPPVKVYYFREPLYSSGIEEIKTGQGSFKIYSAEKTICDAFRYRSKIGEDIALESLKNYLNRQDSQLNKLLEFARITKVEKVITPYLKAILHQ